MNKNDVMMVFNREQEKAPRYGVCLAAGRLVTRNIPFSLTMPSLIGGAQCRC